MTTLFTVANYLGTLVVLGVICFGLGRYDPKFGLGGSFVVMAVVFAIFLPVAALGFYFGKRGFEHRGRTLVLAGAGTGITAALLVFVCDWLFTAKTGTYLIPLIFVFVAGFASARLAETEVAVARNP